MYETIALIQKHFRMGWQYRWVALVCAAAICAAGWAVVLIMPNQYQVTAKIYLDTKTLLTPLLKGIAVESTAQEDEARLMQRTLLVRPNLETVARKTDMDLQADTPESFERLLTQLAKSIRIQGTGRDNIFTISYPNKDPKMATRVVDALLNLFVERSLGESRKDSTKSREFLDAQIREYESRLIAAESRLKEFKRQNVGLMPSDGGTYYGRLESVSQETVQAQLELREAEQRRDTLRNQLSQVGQSLETDGFGSIDVAHPLDETIAEREATLESLLLVYTEKHPDVIAAQTMLDRLVEKRAASLAELAASVELDGSATSSQMSNPVFQELKVGLGATEAEVAALAVRVKEYEARRLQLEKLIDTIPKVEAEFTRLDRDYEVDQANYEALVERREALSIGDSASQSTDGVQFNIIEPPREPLVPTSPNRPILYAGVLFGGLGAGIAVALFMGILNPRIYTKEDFAEISDVPALGSVSRVFTTAEVVRRRLEVTSFALGCLVLFGLFGGLQYMETSNFDLSAKVIEVRERLL